MPVRTIPKNYRNVTGIAASPKAGGAAQFESTLERDFLSLLEFSPEVKVIDPQPVSKDANRVRTSPPVIAISSGMGTAAAALWPVRLSRIALLSDVVRAM